jgi:hypothetical protein
MQGADPHLEALARLGHAPLLSARRFQLSEHLGALGTGLALVLGGFPLNLAETQFKPLAGRGYDCNGPAGCANLQWPALTALIWP